MYIYMYMQLPPNGKKLLPSFEPALAAGDPGITLGHWKLLHSRFSEMNSPAF